jgi:hypothetical protein
LYKSLYKNIDLKVYGIEKQIEYDWIVKPGGNPQDIRFEYKNVKGTRLDDEGNLLIETDFGELIHKKPVSYQKGKAQSARRIAKSAKSVGQDAKISPQRSTLCAMRYALCDKHGVQNAKDTRECIEIDVKFKKIGKNTYGFEVGEYDKSNELIIDPVVLAYSTYLGGENWDGCWAIDVDSSGYIYMIGSTSSIDFPTKNQYQSDQGSQDAFVTKLNPTQSGAASLIYSTYLGGGGIEYGCGIAVDSSGNAYVSGWTSSTDFPILNQYQNDKGGVDAFVTKLDTTQNGASSLIYSTYLGGGSTEYCEKIDVDNNGYAYVIGATASMDFPTLNQYQTFQGGSYDTFVTKLDTTRSGNSSLIYSTYLGGNYYDYGEEIAVDNSGHAYLIGETTSSNFPIKNQYQTDQGDRDVFVTKLDTTQSGDSSLIYSTYLGGNGLEFAGYGIAVDNNGYVYVSGWTESSDFPVLNQYQADQPGRDAFVTKLDTTQSGVSSLIYSTYLGGSGNDNAMRIAVDNSGYVYVTGDTVSTDFPILDQFQIDQPGIDVFVTKLDTTQSGASSLIYSTYLGGNGSDHVIGIAVDSHGNTYITGWTDSTDFPLLNQLQMYQGGYDASLSW